MHGAIRHGVGRSTDVGCYAQAVRVIVQYEGDMECTHREPGSLDLSDAVNVVLARRHVSAPLLATGQEHRHVARPTGHLCFQVLRYDLDR